VRTCGDYMFSGHTVVITLLHFAIAEYTPDDWRGLHMFCNVLNVFGMFFILAAHEHYSIDVFVAFYITSRLFIHYHSLAALSALNHKKVKSLFPVYSYLEQHTQGVVVNEYEWPWEFVYRWWKLLAAFVHRAGTKNGKDTPPNAKKII